uniref:Ig-like domain-containing protein n=1 Tax=Periophthalmus magnuspinnatus TaxID=409849 RepID=A0A3B4AUN2_9GOBI
MSLHWEGRSLSLSLLLYTLRYFETYLSEVPNFPKFAGVGVLNGLEIGRCNPETGKSEPTQKWMNRVTEDDPKFWEWTTKFYSLNHSTAQTDSGPNVCVPGVHIWQRMFGCDWDDDTDDINVYIQYARNGQDVISLDPITDTWVAAKSEAFITKLRWETDGETPRHKHNVQNHCMELLKNAVSYGEKTLKRTGEKRHICKVNHYTHSSSSSPVTCHATGFYPDRARLFWTKDGDELLEDVGPGEILPNGDGTFQTSVSLDLSSVPLKNWDRHHCVFQVSGDKYKYVTRLDRSKIRTNAKNPLTSIIAAVVVVGVVIVAAAVALFVIRRKRGQTGLCNLCHKYDHI